MRYKKEELIETWGLFILMIAFVVFIILYQGTNLMNHVHHNHHL